MKPENILFETKNKDAVIKVIDFGLSQYFNESAIQMTTRIGTPYYMAPEVLEGTQYDQSCDMWSIGVITYCLLCGYPPFNAENDNQLFKKIRCCDYEFDEDIVISEEVKDFIRSLLSLKSERRMTPKEALDHQWIRNASGHTINASVLYRLMMFKKPNAF